VDAEPYSTRPARYSYELSRLGPRAGRRAALLADWGVPGTAPTQSRSGTSVCGTPLEAAWYCPTCDVTEREADASEELHFA